MDCENISLYFCHLKSSAIAIWPLVDPWGWGARDACFQFLSLFMQFLANILPNNRLAHPSQRLTVNLAVLCVPFPFLPFHFQSERMSSYICVTFASLCDLTKYLLWIFCFCYQKLNIVQSKYCETNTRCHLRTNQQRKSFSLYLLPSRLILVIVFFSHFAHIYWDTNKTDGGIKITPIIRKNLTTICFASGRLNNKDSLLYLQKCILMMYSAW